MLQEQVIIFRGSFMDLVAFIPVISTWYVVVGGYWLDTTKIKRQLVLLWNYMITFFMCEKKNIWSVVNFVILYEWKKERKESVLERKGGVKIKFPNYKCFHNGLGVRITSIDKHKIIYRLEKFIAIAIASQHYFAKINLATN